METVERYLPLAAPLSNSIYEPLSSRAARVLFMLMTVWGASIVWLAPHPPMVDLPQHAGQIVLLRDLLFGHSPWEYMFRINPLTPYLLGYGLALPLSMIMPITTALKLLLSLAYLGFVGMCVLLRRHFNGDARLDWLFLTSFFGFAFKWGFFTFLIAVGIGLLFIYLADRYAQQPTVRSGLVLLGVGLLLLMSHGLVFLFGMATGLSLFVIRRGWHQEWRQMLPYGMLLLVCGIYFIVNQQVNAGMHTQLMGTFSLSWGPSRLLKWLMYTVGPNSKDGYMAIKLVGVVALLALPWALGMRIAWEDKARCAPFCVVALIMLLVPDFAWNTAFLYQRFALYILPTYAWMFTARTASLPNEGQGRLRVNPIAARLRPLSALLAVGGCALVLGINTMTFLHFKQESSDFDKLISEIAPRQRVLAIVLDQRSLADRNEKIYAHYSLWYQAEDHGLVDFNFAWFPPQIVRYRQDQLPGVMPGFDWHPERFDWRRARGDEYDYIFIRHLKGIPYSLFDGAKCTLEEIKTEGAWTVFRQHFCQA